MSDTADALVLIRDSIRAKKYDALAGTLKDIFERKKLFVGGQIEWNIVADACLWIMAEQPRYASGIWISARSLVAGAVFNTAEPDSRPETLCLRRLLLDVALLPSACSNALVMQVDADKVNLPPLSDDEKRLRQVQAPRIEQEFLRRAANPDAPNAELQVLYRTACQLQFDDKFSELLAKPAVSDAVGIERLQSLAANAELVGMRRSRHREWLWGERVLAFWRSQGLLA